MVSKRVFAALALTALVLTSGCLGVLTGEESLRFESEPATTDATVASNAGYETNGTQTFEVNRTFNVAGQEPRVVASNHITTYEKKIDLGFFEAKLGVFSVISTPAVDVAGETLNPIGDYSNDQLVGLVESQYRGLTDVERVSSRNVQVLGEPANVTKYSAKATFANDRQVDVYVHVTKVRHDEDFIVAIGVYPQQLGGEEDNVLEMMRSIEHPSEA
ncbi:MULTISPECIES: DUF6517 family protein [Haloferax]|uniref:Lipoprotein n=1 Tax=Haloferax marinum TaxID=2666143 RepID=A0A6A8G4Q6_9EURY|nr:MULTISPECIES: DUF6517 family protein [Haloferax]KAB1196130.1 hypothetical protein Hfx1150_00840 [Haloferax sp. CBA1150]MRW95116.1 hypothetical protein [Haloferax marinum]